jgi:hypothetical protein
MRFVPTKKPEQQSCLMLHRTRHILMPQAGEDRSAISDVFGNVYAHCIELMAGRAAERMLLDGEAVVPADDFRQARELGHADLLLRRGD